MDDRASFKKIWLLAILNAVRAAGIGSVSPAFVHRVVYFTTALAVVSQQAPEAACVIKRDDGPYFPDYAWELERLVGMGLVDTKRQSIDIDEPEAHTLYKISQNGVALLRDGCSQVKSLSGIVSHVGFCIRELAFAGVLLDPKAWHADANQSSRTNSAGDLIDYGEIQPPSQVNLSAIETAQLLGISTESFSSSSEASEALRLGIYWDQREDSGDFASCLESAYVNGLPLASLLSAHGPSLFAQNVGLRRGAFRISHTTDNAAKAGVSAIKFTPPDVAWADEELVGAL